MSIDFEIGFSIACLCLFIVLLILIIFSGCCETIQEEIGLTSHNSEDSGITNDTVVVNPVNNV